MPLIIRQNSRPGTKGTLDNAPKFSYKYPRGLNLDPKGELHKSLLSEILVRISETHGAMSAKYGKWRNLDKTLTSYIRLDQEEAREKAKDDRQPLSIVVPSSHATLETMMTYLVQAFLTQPVFKFSGVGSEDVLGAILMEQIVHRQAIKGQMTVALHTMFRNALVYGVGPISPIWKVTEGYRSIAKPVTGIRGFGRKIRGGKVVERIRERVVRFEGNELHNIDPYRYFPDTNVAGWNVDAMEYVGWMNDDNKMQILAEERASEGEVFNGRYLEYVDGLSIYGQDNSERDPDRVALYGESGNRNSVHRLYLYIDLIPSEWGLGPSQYPEKWLFSVVGDKLIIQAQPLEFDHQQFPIVVCDPETDGFSPLSTSKMETIQGLQQFMNFLYNSHIANVRKAVHDMFVIDPERINLNDVMNPGPGRIIRTRKKAWGQGLDDAIKQLEVSDVTQNHIQESVLLHQVIERSSGASDFLQGILRGGERRTAEEVRTVTGGSLSRLEKMAIMISTQAMQPLGYMIASQTQQFLSSEQYVQLVGRNEADLREVFGDQRRVLVDPLEILVDYDVEVNDGSLPDQGDPLIWTQIYQALLASPEAQQEIDTVRVFKYLAKISGATNLDEFDRKRSPVQTEVQSDEDVERGVERGDIVPLAERI